MGGYGTIYLFCWPQWDKIICVLYNLQINILLDFFQSIALILSFSRGHWNFDRNFSQWNQNSTDHKKCIEKTFGLCRSLFVIFKRQFLWIIRIFFIVVRCDTSVEETKFWRHVWITSIKKIITKIMSPASECSKSIIYNLRWPKK
jgi:hypothetical protein